MKNKIRIVKTSKRIKPITVKWTFKHENDDTLGTYSEDTQIININGIEIWKSMKKRGKGEGSSLLRMMQVISHEIGHAVLEQTLTEMNCKKCKYTQGKLASMFWDNYSVRNGMDSYICRYNYSYKGRLFNEEAFRRWRRHFIKECEKNENKK
jgi:hypothetical protein